MIICFVFTAKQLICVDNIGRIYVLINLLGLIALRKKPTATVYWDFLGAILTTVRYKKSLRGNYLTNHKFSSQAMSTDGMILTIFCLNL